MRRLDDLAEAIIGGVTNRTRDPRKTMFSPCRIGLHRWATVRYRGTTYGRCMDCKKWDELALDEPPEELKAVMDHQVELEK